MLVLTNTGAVKKWLNITVTDDDTLIDRLVEACSEFIEKYLNRNLSAANYVETRNGNGASALTLKNWPINSITTLTVDGVTIAAAAWPTAGYAISERQVLLRGYVFTKDIANIVITYNAGYADPPRDLEQAAIELVSLKYRARTRVGEESKNIGDQTVNYTTEDMLSETRATLNNYREVVPI